MENERWLVKSSGKILGPFTLEEMIQHLRTRNLSIIDEVRDPDTRWGFVREHPLLSEVVRQLRAEDDQRLDATQTSLLGRTVTLSVTDTVSETMDVTPGPPTNPNATGAKPIEARERRVSPILNRAPAYGNPQDPRLQAKLQSASRFWFLFFVVVLLVGGGIAGGLLWHQRQQQARALEQSKQWIREAQDQARIGAFHPALDYIQKAESLTRLNSEEKILKAELLLQAEGRSGEALQILSQVQDLTEPRLIRELGLSRLMSFMHEQKWDEAEIEATQLQNQNANDEEALHNVALLRLYRGHSVTAWDTVQRLVDMGYRNNTLLLLKGMIALNWPGGAGKAKAQQVIEELKKDSENEYEFFFEKGILLSNLYLQVGKNDEALKTVQKIWISDPFDSRNFMTSLNVDGQLFAWEKWVPLCSKIATTFPDDPSAKGVQSLCLFMAGDRANGLLKIDEARKQFSNLASLTALHGLLFLETQQLSEANALAQLTGSENLGFILKARLCETEKDWICSEKNWTEALKNNPINPLAQRGQGHALKQRGNDFAYREVLRKGLARHPRYRPFMESRGELNAL